MTLPTEVVRKDRTLQKSADDLAKLRWHWTLDTTNPDRVTFRAYAREVGAAWNTVSYSANGYAAWLAAGVHDVVLMPGTPQTVGDHIELAKMGAERQAAVKAVARVTGAAISNVAAHKRREVDDVVAVARERALTRGTTVEHQIEEQAEWRAKAAKTSARDKADKTARHTDRFIEVEGHVGAAMQRLRKALAASEDVQFSDEEQELLAHILGKLRALLGLIDLRITGQADVDWDAELAKMGDK